MIALGVRDPQAQAAKLFPDFAEKGKESWTSLDAVGRINKIGKVVSASGGALLGAYGGIYAVSSEVIHGSVYGMSYFFSAHRREETFEAFRSATVEQVIDILIACLACFKRVPLSICECAEAGTVRIGGARHVQAAVQGLNWSGNNPVLTDALARRRQQKSPRTDLDPARVFCWRHPRPLQNLIPSYLFDFALAHRAKTQSSLICGMQMR
ncbi:hypothetical protein WCQ02_15035 [Paraburkholderia tropica]|uniref:hypothetical protein n=1 Tax=Paraburkholderia tropica TaxID=92647 RepID=UPI0030161867